MSKKPRRTKVRPTDPERAANAETGGQTIRLPTEAELREAALRVMVRRRAVFEELADR